MMIDGTETITEAMVKMKDLFYISHQRRINLIQKVLFMPASMKKVQKSTLIGLMVDGLMY